LIIASANTANEPQIDFAVVGKVVVPLMVMKVCKWRKYFFTFALVKMAETFAGCGISQSLSNKSKERRVMHIANLNNSAGGGPAAGAGAANTAGAATACLPVCLPACLPARLPAHPALAIARAGAGPRIRNKPLVS